MIRIAHHGANGHSLFGKLENMKGIRLVAVSGIPRERFDNMKANPDVKRTFAEASFFDDFATVLSQVDFDLAVFCSPRREQQNGQIEQALLSGKHVLAEKPMVTTLTALDRICEAQRKSGKQALAMLNYAYDPIIRTFRDIVDSGEIGEVVQIFGQKSYPYQDSRPQDRGVDGGIIQSAIHGVSFVRFATGREIVEAYGQDTQVGNPKDGELQMGLSIAGRLDNGGLATIIANYCNPPNFGSHGNDQIRIFGTKGVLEAINGFSQVSIGDGKEPLRPLEVREWPETYPKCVLESLIDGSSSLLTMEDSLRCTEIVLRAQESADKNQPVGMSFA